MEEASGCESAHSDVSDPSLDLCSSTVVTVGRYRNVLSKISENTV